MLRGVDSPNCNGRGFNNIGVLMLRTNHSERRVFLPTFLKLSQDKEKNVLDRITVNRNGLSGVIKMILLQSNWNME